MIPDQTHPKPVLTEPARAGGTVHGAADAVTGGRGGRSLGAVVWLGMVALGLGVLMRYSGTAGAVGSVPSAWPAGSAVSREAGRVCVLLFVHPKCPCTRATVRELERVLTPAPENAEVRVVVFDPSGQEEGWAKTGLVEQAGALPGARVCMDRDGAVAGRFGVRTSGHVLVYDGGGRLVFSGGVTGERGHEGDCDGSEAVGAAVRGRAPGVGRTAVFGCGIVGGDGACDGKGAACSR